jgi:hypothetical protein
MENLSSHMWLLSRPAQVLPLQDEFMDMIEKSQWVILTASYATTLPGLCHSAPGAITQWDHQPWWTDDYSWWGINGDTLQLAACEVIALTLNCILCEILLANPAFGPIQLMKIDLSDGFYMLI